MARLLFNLAKMTTATTGTGTITLGSAVAGFLSFADAGVIDADVVTYSIRDGNDSEIGQGTYTAAGTTLSRDVIFESTNADAAISLSGSAVVFITAAAEDIVTPEGTPANNQLAVWTNSQTIEGDANLTWDASTFSVAGAASISGALNLTAGDIVFTEKADHASTPVAGFGYLWVKNTAPSTLVFTDDAGADFELGSGLSNVVEDTTPQLGGALDVNGQEIQSTGDIVFQLGDAAGANILDIQDSAGVTNAKIDSNGTLTLGTGGATGELILGNSTSGAQADGLNSRFSTFSAGNRTIQVGGTTVWLASGTKLRWSPNANLNSGGEDTTLQREAAGIIGQRTGTQAQGYYVYNTYTDASNYERGILNWDTNVFEIGTEAAGSGVSRDVNILPASNILGVGSSDIVFTEKADHSSTPAATFGYLWVKNDVPTSLIFTADDGTDYDLTAAGGGDVTKVGTPVDNQIGVWTGDGTIEGDTDFTFDTASNTFAVAGVAGTSILAMGGANILVDSPRGTMTLSNVDAIDATTETTLEAAIDSLTNLTATGTVTSGTWSANISGATMTGNLAVNANELTSTGDLVIQLGDAAGANAFDIQDSGSTLQAYINSDASLFLREKTAASTDATGFGQVWINSTPTPHQLSFTDESGTDTPVMLAGKHSIWIPAAAMTPAASLPCATGSFDSGTSNKLIRTLDFDSAADEVANFEFYAPASWNAGTITARVVWTQNAAVTTGVAWTIDGVTVADNESIDTAYGTGVWVTDNAQGAALEANISAESSAITIAGAGADELFNFRIYRDVSHANDDMTQDALLIGVVVYLTYDVGNDA